MDPARVQYRVFLVLLERHGFGEDAKELRNAWSLESMQCLVDTFEEGAELLKWTVSDVERLGLVVEWMRGWELQSMLDKRGICSGLFHDGMQMFDVRKDLVRVFRKAKEIGRAGDALFDAVVEYFRTGVEPDSEPEPEPECPICYEAYQPTGDRRKRMLEPCGHGCCEACWRGLLKVVPPRARSLKCWMCREPSAIPGRDDTGVFFLRTEDLNREDPEISLGLTEIREFLRFMSGSTSMSYAEARMRWG